MRNIYYCIDLEFAYQEVASIRERVGKSTINSPIRMVVSQNKKLAWYRCSIPQISQLSLGAFRLHYCRKISMV